jgi:cysteine sulfinate desulfinase/cysteine desulfurase-like protein
MKAFEQLNPKYSGDQFRVMPHVLNVAFEGLDSEALIVAIKDLVAISIGSACTSTSCTPSHVLKAMGMSDDEANACVRISWCHQLVPSITRRELERNRCADCSYPLKRTSLLRGVKRRPYRAISVAA